jgi:outer membrane protein OmpA-like peptidoglycan-associated protein
MPARTRQKTSTASTIGDGCPESDNDNDRIADAADSCANHAEDVDQYKDEDGCPDPDNDFDGIADKDDRCPLKAEVINGNEDDDGCPDEGKVMVVIGKKKLEIQDKIYFATGKDVILPRSEGLIAQVAKTIERNPWIKKLRIEGHTDDVGKDDYNLDLSQRRAAAVRKALIDKGVGEGKLDSAGYGEQNPIDSNKTLDGRAHNRRVEFVIVDQENTPQAEAATRKLNGGAQ